jgi:hypothetical protein
MPLAHELPRPYPWLRWVWANDDPVGYWFSSEVSRQEVDNPVLVARWPDRLIRTAVAREAGLDFWRASAAGAALSADPLHLRLLLGRVQLGEASLVLGRRTLEVVEPRQLSWEEVDELRATRGIREFRAVLRDVEAEAMDEATSLDDLDRRILRAYGDRLERAAGKAPSRRARLGVAGIGLVVGELSGWLAGVPIAGGLVGAGIGEGAAHVVGRLARSRWLAVHRKLRPANPHRS